jgi:WD40 repeat protein/serine/threonine protein kinase
MTVAPAMCPVCGSSYAAQEPVCDNCGLVFASRSPGAALPTAIYSFAQLQPGQALAHGRYIVQRALSTGGMGAIYLASDHETFDRIVVVKAMLDYFDPSDPLAVQAARDRFIQEARTLATLRHPAIPQIYTSFQEGPGNYIVMEYIEGHDLLQRLTHAHDVTSWTIPGRPYAREDVLRWGVALCRVLEYLASRRPDPVVHHDIKPANLLLDSNSGDIRLVDFGTARARLLAQAGRVGLAQSSIYGTQGYAAPEQYSGRSEARSDVYALAATLYHLATDDDPRNHPFEFPRLNELGTLGQELGRALDPAPDKRPAATELRRRLEDLLAPSLPRPIQTPDGLEVYDPIELARWCEANWQLASAWLYGVLPDQVERVWGKTKLAQQMRESALRHRYERSAGLDAALTLLDPQGFGAEQPLINVTARTLDFGALARRAAHSQQLVLTNGGRRHVDASLTLPGWISASRATISMPPGARATVELSAEGDRAPARGQLRDFVTVHDGPTTLLDVEVRAAISRWSAFQWHRWPWLLALVPIVALFLLWRWMIVPWNSSGPPPLPYPTLTPVLSQRPYPSPTDFTPPATAELPLSAYPALVQAPTGAYPEPLQRGSMRHSRRATSVAFSPDGGILASGGLDEAVRLWRTSDGGLVRALSGHSRGVSSVAFSPDGLTLAVGSLDGTLRLWRVADGKLLWKIDGHDFSVLSVTFSPDGRTIVSGGTDTDVSSEVKLWRTSDGKLLWAAEGHTSSIWSVVVSHNGQMIASGSRDGTVRLWRLSDGKLLRRLNLASDVYAVAFSHDDQLLATGGNGPIRFWTMSDGTEHILGWNYDGDGTRSLVFSPDGQRLAWANIYHGVKIRQVLAGAGAQALEPSSGQADEGPYSVVFSPDGQLIAAGDPDGQIKIWNIAAR